MKDIYVCSECAWEGYESELKEICIDDCGIKMFEDTCPNCNNNEFFVEENNGLV